MIYLAWIIAASADVIASVHAFRQAAQAPGCEYGIELELLGTNGPAEIPVEVAKRPMGPIELVGSPFVAPARLGLYSVGDYDELMNLILRDLLDGCGVREDWPKLEVDWASVDS
jgi:hypothetical protein